MQQIPSDSTLPHEFPDNNSPNEFPERLDIAKVCIYGLSIISASVFLFLPFINLLHPSPWQRWMGTIHGFAALLTTVTIVYAAHLVFPLLRNNHHILPQMRTLTFWATFLAFLSIVSGNWALMRYRAPLGGARFWFQENTPLVHHVLFQFHQFSVLATVPLGTACTWILWKYGNSILNKQNYPVLTATCIGLMAMMFFAIADLVTGLGIAKIRAL
jgi:hypothetical protein